MTFYLLDTDIVSALAPTTSGKPPPDPAVVDWIYQHGDSLFLSAVTAIEIEAGLLSLGRRMPGHWQREMSDWFAILLEQFVDRVLSLDLRVARAAAVISDRNAERGMDPGIADILIAATAASNGMTLLTRNLRHFVASGVEAIDPFKALPKP